jgi:spore maturation protein CgeB
MNIETLKTWLKQCRLIYAANALLKSNQLKRGVRNVTRYYEEKNTAEKKCYSEANAITEFKARHRQLCPCFSAKAMGNLNIFWVGASQAQDESGFLQALERLGNVTTFHNSHGDYGPHYELSGLHWLKVREINDASLVEQVERVHGAQKIDCLMGQMWSHVYSEEAMLKVRSLGIPVINVAMDDRLPNLWMEKSGQRMGAVGLASGVDITLTTAPEVCRWYSIENMPAVFWPLASDKNLFVSEQDARKDIDILFIGNRYGIRGKLVGYLRKHGISVTCYGNGWPNGYVNAEQNIALSKRARIILGIGAIGHCSDIYTLKLRDFDSLMTGALYITHRNPDLLKLFTEGEHLECYKGPEELLVKLNHYLRRPDECAEIGKRGQALVKTKHSWDYRLNTTFVELGLLSRSLLNN